MVVGETHHFRKPPSLYIYISHIYIYLHLCVSSPLFDQPNLTFFAKKHLGVGWFAHHRLLRCRETCLCDLGIKSEDGKVMGTGVIFGGKKKTCHLNMAIF